MNGFFIVIILLSVISIAIVIRKNISVGLYTFLSLSLVLVVFTMGALVYSESGKVDAELVEKGTVEIYSFQYVGEYAYYRDEKDVKSKMVNKEDFIVEETGLNENSSVQVYERKGTSKIINWLFGDVSYGKYYVFKLSENDKIKAES